MTLAVHRNSAWSDQQPIGASLTERHLRAAGVHHASSDHPSNCIVCGQTTNTPSGSEQRQETVLEVSTVKFVFVPRRPEQEHVTHSWNLYNQRLRSLPEFACFRPAVPRGPANDLVPVQGAAQSVRRLFEHSHFAVALNEIDGRSSSSKRAISP